MQFQGLVRIAPSPPESLPLLPGSQELYRVFPLTRLFEGRISLCAIARVF